MFQVNFMNANENNLWQFIIKYCSKEQISFPQQFSLLHLSLVKPTPTLFDNGKRRKFQMQNGSMQPHPPVANHLCVSQRQERACKT